MTERFCPFLPALTTVEINEHGGRVPVATPRPCDPGNCALGIRRMCALMLIAHNLETVDVIFPERLTNYVGQME